MSPKEVKPFTGLSYAFKKGMKNKIQLFTQYLIRTSVFCSSLKVVIPLLHNLIKKRQNIVNGIWIVYVTFSNANQKVLSSLAEFWHERAVSPYLFSHSRKIPGGWKEKESRSLGIINAPTNSNPLPQLKKQKQKQKPINCEWLDYVGLRKVTLLVTTANWRVWSKHWGLLEQTNVTTRGKSSKICLEAQKLVSCASKKG